MLELLVQIPASNERKNIYSLLSTYLIIWPADHPPPTILSNLITFYLYDKTRETLHS